MMMIMIMIMIMIMMMIMMMLMMMIMMSTPIQICLLRDVANLLVLYFFSLLASIVFQESVSKNLPPQHAHRELLDVQGRLLP